MEVVPRGRERESRRGGQRPLKQNFTELYVEHRERKPSEAIRMEGKKMYFDRSLRKTSHSEWGGKDVRSHSVNCCRGSNSGAGLLWGREGKI